MLILSAYFSHLSFADIPISNPPATRSVRVQTDWEGINFQWPSVACDSAEASTQAGPVETDSGKFLTVTPTPSSHLGGQTGLLVYAPSFSQVLTPEAIPW